MREKPKFTPGSWQVFVEGNDVFVDPWICEKTCQSEAEKESAIANANLIAAAPEMYAELKDLLDAMEAGLFSQAVPGVDYPAAKEKKWELRKLLKAAR